MASFNRVILLGNLTRDVELKHTQGGTAVTEVGLAVNDRRKDQAGKIIEETTFVDVTLWGRTAEIAAEYLGKGSPILVEGRLKLDTWEQDGKSGASSVSSPTVCRCSAAAAVNSTTPSTANPPPLAPLMTEFPFDGADHGSHCLLPRNVRGDARRRPTHGPRASRSPQRVAR